MDMSWWIAEHVLLVLFFDVTTLNLLTVLISRIIIVIVDTVVGIDFETQCRLQIIQLCAYHFAGRLRVILDRWLHLVTVLGDNVARIITLLNGIIFVRSNSQIVV